MGRRTPLEYAPQLRDLHGEILDSGMHVALSKAFSACSMRKGMRFGIKSSNCSVSGAGLPLSRNFLRA